MTTPDGPFWELVKAEIRATWCGRWRWLWWFLAACTLGFTVFIPHGTLTESPWLAPFWLAVFWAPLVLGADLLCTRFPENLEPAREWPPRAFFARGIARLAPVLVVILGAYLAITIRDSDNREPLESASDLLSMITIQPALFALAALLGSGSRRPRRWLITLGLQACGLAFVGLDLGVAELINPSFRIPHLLIISASTYMALEAYLQFCQDAAVTLFPPVQPLSDADNFLLVSSFKVSLPLLLFVSVYLLAQRRFRESPYTATTDCEADAGLPSPDAANPLHLL